MNISYHIIYTSAGCTYPLRGWWKESADRQNQVEGAKEKPFEPGRFAIQTDECVEPGHQGKQGHFQQREVEVERHTYESACQYEDGSGQQSDLDRRASGDSH